MRMLGCLALTLVGLLPAKAEEEADELTLLMQSGALVLELAKEDEALGKALEDKKAAMKEIRAAREDDAELQRVIAGKKRAFDKAVLTEVKSGQLNPEYRAAVAAYVALNREHIQLEKENEALQAALAARDILPMMRRDHKSVFAALSARVASI